MAQTFTDRWRELDWDDITLRINSKTAADVERALAAQKLTRDDFMALLSPATSQFLEPLAQKAQYYKWKCSRWRNTNTLN